VRINQRLLQGILIAIFSWNAAAQEPISPQNQDASRRATWVWGESWEVIFNPEKTGKFFAFCAQPPSGASRISDIYLNLPYMKLKQEDARPQIAAFVKAAHAKKIRVHLLAGSADMSYSTSTGFKIIENIAAYNQAVPEESRLDGLHLDIEPHTMGVMWTQDDRLRNRYMESMKKYYEKFKEIRGSMLLGIDIPVGYADDPPLLESLIDSSDYLGLMDYRDNAGMIIDGAEDIIDVAAKKGKKVVIGVETQRPNKKYGVTPMLTFWDEGSERMEKVLNEVQQHFSTNNAYAGIAVHHYASYAGLTPGPQVIVDNRKFPVLPTLTAKRVATPPKIDGDLSEWTGAPTVEIKEPKEVVYGKGAWKSADDLSAKAWIGWDENNFYFAIDVTDDHVVQPFETKKMVNGDHIELWLDLDPEKNKDSGVPGEGVWQLGLSPGNFADHPAGIIDWVPGGLLKKHTDEIEIKSTKSDKGYRIEARIPWALLGKFRPADGRVFRVNIDPSDTDSAEKPFQETLMSTSPYREWGNPKTFRLGVFQQ